MAMQLRVIKARGLAHNSYFLSDGGEAIVFDPRRDCAAYTQLAEEECARITYIVETHRHEDFVVGSLELQNETDAEIAHSKEGHFKYGQHNLVDSDKLTIGRLSIKAFYTPGHTNDSMCYAVYESINSYPLMVFTGDTIFAGEVGRTDLLGREHQQHQSEKLYESIHEKVLPLGDHVLVYPAHGSGSVCGFQISDRECTSIGYERKANVQLQLDKASFVKHIMRQPLLIPPYFAQMEQYNLNGPPPLRNAFSPLSVAQFEEEMSKPDTVVIDAREPGAFAGSHIPGALNIWLNGLSLFPGWVVTCAQRILLVVTQPQDVLVAQSYLWRLGFDNLIGYLCSGIQEWRNSGKPFDHVDTLSADQVKAMLDLNAIIVLDVRDIREWEAGHIRGAKHIYVGRLKDEAYQLPKDMPLVTQCTVGNRAGLAASILKKMGFSNVYNLLGGIRAWQNRGYPVEGGK
jgi:hydroxyacylglutathione hydrolase